jgi:hypothetical protein
MRLVKYIIIKTGGEVPWVTGTKEIFSPIALEQTRNPNSMIKFGSSFYANSIDLIDQRIKNKFLNNFGTNLSDYTFISAIWGKNILLNQEEMGLFITKEIIFSGNRQILTKNITDIQSDLSGISVNTVNETIILFGLTQSQSDGLIPVIQRDISKAIT